MYTPDEEEAEAATAKFEITLPDDWESDPNFPDGLNTYLYVAGWKLQTYGAKDHIGFYTEYYGDSEFNANLPQRSDTIYPTLEEAQWQAERRLLERLKVVCKAIEKKHRKAWLAAYHAKEAIIYKEEREFAQFLKSCRAEKRITQKVAAETMQIMPSTLGYIERATYLPYRCTMLKLQTLYGFTQEEIEQKFPKCAERIYSSKF